MDRLYLYQTCLVRLHQQCLYASEGDLTTTTLTLICLCVKFCDDFFFEIFAVFLLLLFDVQINFSFFVCSLRYKCIRLSWLHMAVH